METLEFVIYVKGVPVKYFSNDEETIKTVTVAIINDTLGADKPEC